MNTNIDNVQIERITNHFKKVLNIQETTAENVYYSLEDTKRLKKEISRLKLIIRTLNPNETKEIKLLLADLQKELKCRKR
jgi:hypothetical protein